VPVCGTVTLIAPREVFLGSVELASWFDRSRTSPLSSELATLRICLEDPPTIAAGDIRGSSPSSLSRAGIWRLTGCQLPDAILHGKRSCRPHSRAVQCLTVTELLSEAS
jgi:hypothetical protein